MLDLFQPMTPDMVDKALDRCCATTSSLDPCLAWLIKAARSTTAKWAMAIINGFLQDGKVPLALKETIIRSIRKKPNSVADNIGNYRPVANVSFLSKVAEPAPGSFGGGSRWLTSSRFFWMKPMPWIHSS